MTSKEISVIIANKMLGTNYTYMSCDERPELLSFLLTHAEYSHISQRSRYSISVYWHCEGSPTGVSNVGAFDPKRLKEACQILGDPIAEALYAW